MDNFVTALKSIDPTAEQIPYPAVACCLHICLNTGVWLRNIQMIHKNMPMLHMCEPHESCM